MSATIRCLSPTVGPEDAARITIREGDRLRLRLINPSADTIFCVFVERRELEVVRADRLRGDHLIG